MENERNFHDLNSSRKITLQNVGSQTVEPYDQFTCDQFKCCQIRTIRSEIKHTQDVGEGRGKLSSDRRLAVIG